MIVYSSFLLVDLTDVEKLKSKRESTDVQILYTQNGRRVRVKSATKEEKARGRSRPEENTRGRSRPEENPRGRPHQDPVKRGRVEKRQTTKARKEKENREKPLWNHPKHKKNVKNSEKDLNYERRRAESESRKAKREEQLLGLIEANRDRIPTERYTPSHSRNASPASDRGRRAEKDRQGHYSKSRSPAENNHRGEQKTWRVASPSPHRSVSPTQPQPAPHRLTSPPVPALRHGNNSDRQQYSNRKYEDVDPLDIPLSNGEFVPIMRTVEILDPAKAGSPLSISREASVVTNARKAYLKGMQPGSYGKKFERYDDRMKATGEENSLKVNLMSTNV